MAAVVAHFRVGVCPADTGGRRQLDPLACNRLVGMEEAQARGGGFTLQGGEVRFREVVGRGRGGGYCMLMVVVVVVMVVPVEAVAVLVVVGGRVWGWWCLLWRRRRRRRLCPIGLMNRKRTACVLVDAHGMYKLCAQNVAV